MQELSRCVIYITCQDRTRQGAHCRTAIYPKRITKTLFSVATSGSVAGRNVPLFCQMADKKWARAAFPLCISLSILWHSHLPDTLTLYAEPVLPRIRTNMKYVWLHLHKTARSLFRSWKIMTHLHFAGTTINRPVFFHLPSRTASAASPKSSLKAADS